ncbi:2-dehydropantoate 2-reductase [Cytobacillus eiseniae]|uniref:2-dehydropantoate 2-reductase n=1 Tax=Cytobacillus eiseniae TaxID=762947 RepID=A0ABS4RGN6_9BACI|nr:ketopantoate reductase family protein [Cytobacillus eiseniae]MBP2242046.1 2-dehydropantoate 2-reductase [Cytobacillus eiseniae]
MNKIAILGAGSLGTIIGAYLSKGNQEVVLIDVNEEHVNALNETGAKVSGTVDFTTRVKAITPSEMEGSYDLVLLLTKQTFNKSVLENLTPFLHKESIVLSLQNGVPEETVASLVGKERVIGGSVEFGATWIGPGESSLTTEEKAFKQNAFQIGELDGLVTERVNKVKEILDVVGSTSISTNLVGTKWTKLLVNVAMSGMSAALGCTYGDIIDNDISVEAAARLADETIKAGHSIGVEFVEMAGLNFNIFEIKDETEVPQKMAILRQALKPQALLKASMLQDLEKGRKTEIGEINGVIPETGNPNGVKTPFNQLVVKLVRQAEETGKLPKFEDNLTYFEELLKTDF